jgi:HAD superfamily hydrolase (TIGR01509 family)
MEAYALVFDLDGLIVDTESSDYEAWAQAYRDWGHELPRDAWTARIGSDGGGFDPLAHLAALVGGAFDPEAMQSARRARRDAMLRALDAPMPGVAELLDAAEARGLRRAVASSSEREWVEARLAHAGLHERFHALRCKEDVPSVKPDPELYLAAAAALEVSPESAIAFEDSPNGVAAARAAGLFCVAVPGPMTRGLDFGQADWVVTSLAEVRLEAVLERAARARAPGRAPTCP